MRIYKKAIYRGKTELTQPIKINEQRANNENRHAKRIFYKRSTDEARENSLKQARSKRKRGIVRLISQLKYTPYQERVRECFAQAFRFMDEHKRARTNEDWEQIVASLALYTDPFTVDLIVACFNELEREYKESSPTLYKGDVKIDKPI